MLCVQHIILVLFLDTPDDYIPHLPYHWPEVIGLGSGQWKWGKVMHMMHMHAHKPLQDLPLQLLFFQGKSEESKLALSQDGQVWVPGNLPATLK